MAADVELVEPVGVPLVVVLELALEVLDEDVLVDEDEVVALGAALGLGAFEDGDGELWPLVCVDECDPAKGSTYCWSPAEGAVANTVAGASMAAALAAMRQTISLRRM